MGFLRAGPGGSHRVILTLGFHSWVSQWGSPSGHSPVKVPKGGPLWVSVLGFRQGWSHVGFPPDVHQLVPKGALQ